MSSSEQLYRPADQSRSESTYSAVPDSQQAPAAAESERSLGAGTGVMGEPVNPAFQSQARTANNTSSVSYPSADGTSGPSTGGGSNPYTTGMPSSGNFPSAAAPDFSASAASANTRAGQTPIANSDQSAMASQQAGAAGSASPYIQTSSVPGGTGKSPMDNIMQVFNKWGKKAEDMTGNVWSHLRTGPNIADAALGRLAIGTKAMTEGGLENVYRQTFDVAPDEHLLKSYACYLSTSTGPVAGTLYISTHKLAFCSDRPLAIPSSPTASASPTESKKSNTKTKTPSTTSNTNSADQQQQQWCYYKIMVPISQLEAVNPSESTQKKIAEKYVQVKTVDGHEFWFMGFVNYDKGVKNLQEALSSKNASPTSNTNAAAGYQDPANREYGSNTGTAAATQQYGDVNTTASGYQETPDLANNTYALPDNATRQYESTANEAPANATQQHGSDANAARGTATQQYVN